MTVSMSHIIVSNSSNFRELLPRTSLRILFVNPISLSHNPHYQGDDGGINFQAIFLDILSFDTKFQSISFSKFSAPQFFFPFSEYILAGLPL